VNGTNKKGNQFLKVAKIACGRTSVTPSHPFLATALFVSFESNIKILQAACQSEYSFVASVSIE
jgi:hypothetical protein